MAALAPCALAVALTAAPAAAASCTSLSNVQSFSGTVSMAYSNMAGPGGSDGQQTISMDHSGSSLMLASMTPDPADQDFTGQVTGGEVKANDTYSDTGTDPETIGAQTADGPDSGADQDSGEISFTPSSCVYEVSASMSIDTKTTGNGPNDPSINDTASSAFELPYNSLNLSGSETIAAYAGSGGDSLSEINAGEYIVGTPFSGWSLAMNSVSGAQVGQQVGTATFSWNFTPTLKTKVCTVPTLAGLTQAAATTALTKANCALGTVTTQASTTVAKGKVISSNPAAGNVEAGGTKVALTVSSGPNCTVPALAGDTLAAAKAALKAANCATGTETKKASSSVAKGDVISSSPGVGSTQAKGFKVKLTVSSGPRCTVPALAGDALAGAKSALKSAHCGVGAVTKKASSSVAKGDVISSSPGAGSTHSKGTKVKLTVSSGPAYPVPAT
jgi:beta-lactam-binding protein with PASTA domain